MFDLENAKQSGNYRVLKQSNSVEKYIFLNGKKLLNLASNDYLGIATNTSLRDEFIDTLKGSGLFFGSGASRLVYSSSDEFSALESEFEAIFHGKKALIFNSGYAANLGAISSLADEKTLFLADKLIHASMIDALKISGANFKRFAHNDMDALANLLDINHEKYEKIIILTEAIFSMDGDCAPLQTLVCLKKTYENILLYVDEAHSFFALNSHGNAVNSGLDREIDFILVTFSKALGGSGAVFLSDARTREILVNSARSLIYSTALPSLSVAWTRFILGKDFSTSRENLKQNIDLFGLSKTQICPFIVGEGKKTLKLAQKLCEFGYFIPAIRPPTVPHGKARLRISLRADIGAFELKKLKEILDENKNTKR